MEIIKTVLLLGLGVTFVLSMILVLALAQVRRERRKKLAKQGLKAKAAN